MNSPQLVGGNDKISTDALAMKFQQWYGHRHGHSPVYETVIGELVHDRELLGIAVEGGDRDYVHYLFMAAVHYLLLEGTAHSLAAYYGTVVDNPGPPSEIYPLFRDFCFQQKDNILALVSQRQVQINEVRRCAPLMLALAHATLGDRNRPLALVDVGAAAGLNLLLDHFYYDFGAAGRVGNPHAELKLSCEPRGSGVLPVSAGMPRIAWRVGIDVQPVDVSDPHATNWLVALCAPDDLRRLGMLRPALGIARKNRVEVVAGNACEALPKVLAGIPPDLTPCVIHCFTTHHFDAQELVRFHEILMHFGKTRDFHWVSLEWERGDDGSPDFLKPTPLRLSTFQRGERTDSLLATVDPRGGCEWIEWSATSRSQG